VENHRRWIEMAETKKNGVLDSLLRMPRFGPALFAALLGGIMMLFLNELGQNIKAFMIPSLIIYALGAAFLGSIHRSLGSHYVKEGDINNEKPIPCGWKIALLAMHFLWFVALVVYNFWRLVL
jgi:hypothetical protein